MYSTRKPYIEARPWLLSAVSANLLAPALTRQQIVVIPDTCPSSATVDYDAKLWEAYQDSLRFSESTLVSNMESDGTYTTYSKNSAGKYESNVIGLLGGNPFLIASFTISGVLSLLVGFGLAFILNR
jgi:hypothetical protein